MLERTSVYFPNHFILRYITDKDERIVQIFGRKILGFFVRIFRGRSDFRSNFQPEKFTSKIDPASGVIDLIDKNGFWKNRKNRTRNLQPIYKRHPLPTQILGREERPGALTCVEQVGMQLFCSKLLHNKNICILLLTIILICAICFLDALRCPFFIFSPPGFTSSFRHYLKFSKGESFSIIFPRRWPPIFFKSKQCVVKWPCPGPLAAAQGRSEARTQGPEWRTTSDDLKKINKFNVL